MLLQGKELVNLNKNKARVPSIDQDLLQYNAKLTLENVKLKLRQNNVQLTFLEAKVRRSLIEIVKTFYLNNEF